MAKSCDISAVYKRISDLEKWLEKNAPECHVEQKHLDEGTQERVYWHYGYLVALRDVLRMLTEPESPNQKQRSADTSNSYHVA